MIMHGSQDIKLPEEPAVRIKNSELNPNPELASVSLFWQDENIEAIHQTDFRQYQVRGGDKIGRIAESYGLNPESLISLNQLNSPQDLYPGRILLIPELDGFRYHLGRKETPIGIAAKWGVDIQNLQDLGERSYYIPGKIISSNYWSRYMKLPHNGIVLKGYGKIVDNLTGIETMHKGINISAHEGEPVVSVEKGRVVERGIHSFFGKYIIVSHPGGFQSFYGHLDSFGVSEGSIINKGDLVGYAGKSGQTDRVQTYFSLFKDEKIVDPESFLF